MKTAYIETLINGDILVEVQTKVKKKTESDFKRFESNDQLIKFKEDNTEIKFIQI